MKSNFVSAIQRTNKGRPPVWFMRQAGRYHSHYQGLKANHTFMELCKNPVLASEVTMGPIEDFDFDAAILFSDLLFPLEAMGLGLTYEPGPKLRHRIRTLPDLRAIHLPNDLHDFFGFQGAAIQHIRTQLPQQKGLIGFVGAPFTLYYYAVEGTHLESSPTVMNGLHNGLFAEFCEYLIPTLKIEMCVQAAAGADTIALFDTCAGATDPATFKNLLLPSLQNLIRSFHDVHPDVPVIYYSKGTTPAHWESLRNSRSQVAEVLGVDWKTPIKDVITNFGNDFAIQGNFDPNLMLLSTGEFESEVRAFFDPIQKLTPEQRAGWICGLGHGVLQTTPEANVRKFIQIQHEVFGS